jgi:hypothetical protein
MSTAANVVLFADQGEPDWVAQTAYYGNPTGSPNTPNDALVTSTGIAADSNGNIVGIAVGNDPGAGFGLHCYNKYGGLTQIRVRMPLEVTGGSLFSPEGTAVTLPDGSVKVFYTPTFDDPGGINTTQAFNIFDVNVATGAYTTFAVGRDANINVISGGGFDGGFTNMTSAGGDSGGNFYGCGFTRRSGPDQYPYLVKYNSAGAVQWTIVLQPQLQQFTGGGVETANFGTGAAVTVDNDGNSYVRLRHTTNSQIPTFTEKLMKFNSSGTQQWVRIVEGPQGGNPSATDGTYVYSANIPTSTTIRVVATNVSDGTVAWERTLTVTGNTFVGSVRGVIVFGGHVYVLSQANNGLSGADSNNGMTWMKLSTSGNFELNRHIFASSTSVFGSTFGDARQGIIAGSKMYTTFQGLKGVTTVKLPLDGSKLGMLGSMPYLSGIPDFPYLERQADINVVELPITATTTSTATSTASTYGTTTTTLTTSDVFVLNLNVTLDKTQISSIVASPTRPAVLYAKRQLR